MSVLRELGKKSTVKGVPRIFLARSKCMTVVWVVVVIAFLALTAYQMATTAKTYLAYPRSSSVHQVFETSPQPNQVTLCNLNPFAGTASEQTGFPTLQEFYDAVTAATSCSNCSPEEAEVQRQFRQRLLTPAGYYAHVGAENAQSMSHSAEAFFASCQLLQDGVPSASAPCSEVVNITESHNSMYYTCFTVDLPQTTSLTIVLHLDNFFTEPYRFFTSSPGAALMSGVKAMFHEQGQPPVPSDGSLALSPGTFSSVDMDVMRSMRLQPPYSDCSENEMIEGMYSRPVCAALVRLQSIWDHCGCIYSGYYEELAELDGESCLDVQQADPNTTFACVKQILADETLTSEHCPVACSETVFGYQVSQTVWPGWPFQENFYDEYIAGRAYESRYTSLQGLTVETATDEHLDLLDRNFLALSIHPDRNGILEYREVVAYSLMDMLYDMAIITHIWLGISLVVVFELIEIMVELCCSCGRRKEKELQKA